MLEESESAEVGSDVIDSTAFVCGPDISMDWCSAFPMVVLTDGMAAVGATYGLLCTSA